MNSTSHACCRRALSWSKRRRRPRPAPSLCAHQEKVARRLLLGNTPAIAQTSPLPRAWLLHLPRLEAPELGYSSTFHTGQYFCTPCYFCTVFLGSCLILTNVHQAQLFRRYLNYCQNGDMTTVDASNIISAECFREWSAHRTMNEQDAAKAFRRILGAHIIGLDGRHPFPPEEKLAILQVVRCKRLWPALEDSNLTIGKRDFQSFGFHEKRGSINLFQYRFSKKPMQTNLSILSLRRGRLKSCAGIHRAMYRQTLVIPK